MNSPHRPEFRYRVQIVTFILVGAIFIAFIDPTSYGRAKFSDAIFICVASVFSYAAMRLFVWFLTSTLGAAWPRLLRAWGLAWFYGAIPLSLFGLYVGVLRSHSPMPNGSTVAFVVAWAASISAGALPAVRVPDGSSNQRLERP